MLCSVFFSDGYRHAVPGKEDVLDDAAEEEEEAESLLPGLIRGRTVIDIHFFSIRSLTFYFSIPIISIRL